MGYDELKRRVWQANIDLVDHGLVVLTWGNASGIDRESGVVAIKPSGVAYDTMKPEDMVLMSLADGNRMEDGYNPSSDTPTHLQLYRDFPNIGGVVHTHSQAATSWAQAGKPIPCFGTTHADYFYGEIPIARNLSSIEIKEAYEEYTGKVIVECFRRNNIPPLSIPGVLLPFHGPFAWGKSVETAVENAVVLEKAAQMALASLQIDPKAKSIPQDLLDKHFLRKHGPGAYYGQDSEH